jgi:MATE family multidrug resistance protein
MFANFIAYWLIGIPLGCFLCFYLDWGALGIWIGLCVGLMIIGAALLAVWRNKRFAELRQFQAAPR